MSETTERCIHCGAELDVRRDSDEICPECRQQGRHGRSAQDAYAAARWQSLRWMLLLTLALLILALVRTCSG